MKQIFIYVFVFLFVVSCGGGGGGGGGGSTTPPNPAPSVNLSASLTEQLVNSNVTLTWSSSNATSCSASGDWSGTKSTSSSQDVTISKAGSNTYSLSCSGAGGTRSDVVSVIGYRNTDGIVVDGYISGADVFIDENDNFINDGSEYSTTSDNEGKFTIRYANGNLVSLGGTDLDSQTLLDNLLITHKLTGHSEFKAVTPVTSIAAFMEVGANINNALGIDSAIDISITDPVANKGDGGIYDFLYEKGNQLTVLAYALQNITNDLNTTNETTEDYFKAIAEEIETEFNETSVKVDIETETFVNKAFTNVIATKSVTIDEAAKANTVKALSGFLPIVEVKASDNLTTSVIRFAVSTLQEDIKAVANGTASAEKVASYTSDVIDYIAQDQNINSNDITPDISAIDDSITTAEDTPVNIQILANDSYITTAPISISATNGDNGTVEVAESSPEQITYSPNTDYFGSDTFSYTITQGGKVSSADVNVTITPVNDMPSIDVASTIQVAENQTTVTTISVSDADENELTLTLGGTDAESFNLSDEYVLSFKEAPDYENKTSYSIGLTLTDGIEIINKNISINIIDIQEVFPINDSVQEMEDSSIRIDVLKNDSFIGLNPIIEYDEPINGYIEIDNTAQSINEYGHQTLIFYPNTNWFGEESINYYLTVGGEQRTAKIDIKYLPINDPPEIKDIKRNLLFTVEGSNSSNGNVYTINRVQNKDIVIDRNSNYTFVFPQNHPMLLSLVEDGTHNGGEILQNGINYTEEGSIQFLSESLPDLIYYFCELHPGMGGKLIKSDNAYISYDLIENNASQSLIDVDAYDIEGDDLEFTLSGKDKTLFSINQNGILEISNSFDYENPTDNDNDNFYEVSLNVSDGFITVSRDLILNILDENLPVSQLGSDIFPMDGSVKTEFTGALDLDYNGTNAAIGVRSNYYNYTKTYPYTYLNNQWVEKSSIYSPYNCSNPLINSTGDLIVCVNNYRYYHLYEYRFEENEQPTSMGDWVKSGPSSGSSTSSIAQTSPNRYVLGDKALAYIYNTTNESEIVVFNAVQTNQGERFGQVKYKKTVTPDRINETTPATAYYKNLTINNDASIIGLITENHIEGNFIRFYNWNEDISDYNQIGEPISGCSGNLRSIDTYRSNIKLNKSGNSFVLSEVHYEIEDDGINEWRGAICIFDLINEKWIQRGSTIVGKEANDRLAGSGGDRGKYMMDISDDANIIAVSSYEHFGDIANPGMVRIYQWSNLLNDWVQTANDIIGDYENDDSVIISLSGDGKKIGVMDLGSSQNNQKEVRFYNIPIN